MGILNDMTTLPTPPVSNPMKTPNFAKQSGLFLFARKPG
jgi:hypothetical protein